MERGGDAVLFGSGSGFGRVRARAILQAFAPRSRTWGKWRLMSYSISVPLISLPVEGNHTNNLSERRMATSSLK